MLPFQLDVPPNHGHKK